jgi:hypothetical protein
MAFLATFQTWVTAPTPPSPSNSLEPITKTTWERNLVDGMSSPFYGGGAAGGGGGGLRLLHPHPAHKMCATLPALCGGGRIEVRNSSAKQGEITDTKPESHIAA